jgi:hypothetical protein
MDVLVRFLCNLGVSGCLVGVLGKKDCTFSSSEQSRRVVTVRLAGSSNIREL